LTLEFPRSLLPGVCWPPSKPGRIFCFAILIGLVLTCAGCWKKSGFGEVTAKDYVPAHAATETPNESPTANPGDAAAPSAEQTPREPTDASPEIEYAEDKSDDRIGPPLDSRATHHEQWIVSVRLIENNRRIDVRVDQPQFEKLHVGDRVHVSYREGKYTGTVWASQID
jgi:hypothetical protein